VSDFSGYVGGGASGSTALITGNGSAWNNSESLYVGGERNSEKGELSIDSGGQVSSKWAYLGYDVGSVGTAKVSGAQSRWTNGGSMYIGYNGTGALYIEAGGQVSNAYGCTLGLYAGSWPSSGTATVSGIGSALTINGALNVGYNSSGTLNIGSGIGSGGLVTTTALTLANRISGTATCSINGGILQAGIIAQGQGSASLNWIDGTIRNYDPSSDLTVSNSNNLTLKLAATGTHAFNIDAGRIGTVDAILADATSGGTLTKLGDGFLTLTAANTYTGDTSVEDGTLSISVPYLCDSADVHIDSGAKLDLAFTGSDTVRLLYLDGSLMPAGTWGSSLSGATNIDDAHFSGKGTLAVTVPEPSTLLLLGSFLSILALAWKRRAI
jgi:T5SS/PEP-CTERM-associated repeat protein/autotransporter-associated beta strand protein